MLAFHQRFAFLYKSVMLSFKIQAWFSRRVSLAPAPQPSVGSDSAAPLRERGGQLASAPPGPAAAAAAAAADFHASAAPATFLLAQPWTVPVTH